MGGGDCNKGAIMTDDDKGSIFFPKEEKYKIADKEVIIRPLPLKKYREFFEKFNLSIGAISKIETWDGLMEILVGKAHEFLACVCSEQEFPFLTQEFVQDNVTTDDLLAIWEIVKRQNHLKDIFSFFSMLGLAKIETKGKTT